MTKSEEFFIGKGEATDAQTSSPDQTKITQKVQTERKSTVEPKATEKENIAQAFGLIEGMIEQGYRFSDKQMDIGIKISLTRIPEPTKGWFKEICGMVVSRPFWQVLWGQFIRNQENGQAQAPILDPTWEPGNEMAAEFAICRYCDTQFRPKQYGQIFCSNTHSAFWNRDQKGAVNGN